MDRHREVVRGSKPVIDRKPCKSGIGQWLEQRLHKHLLVPVAPSAAMRHDHGRNGPGPPGTEASSVRLRSPALANSISVFIAPSAAPAQREERSECHQQWRPYRPTYVPPVS